MSIIQGSNAPIIVDLEDSIDSTSDITICIYNRTTGKLLKEWRKADVTRVSEDVVSCPLTQDETASFPVPSVTIAIKCMATTGDIVFFKEGVIKVERRTDKGVRL